MQISNTSNINSQVHVGNEAEFSLLPKQNSASHYSIWNLLLAVLLFVLLATPWARIQLEQYMLSHVLVQIPLLVVVGGWITNEISKYFRIKIPLHISLPLLILALTTAMYWMLPRVLDASLEYASYEILKFITLPCLLGAPLVLGWRNVGAITKSFFTANLLSMLLVLAWLYIEAPIRLCNYYLINEQKLLGESILFITATLSLFCVVKVFVGNNKPSSVERF